MAEARVLDTIKSKAVAVTRADLRVFISFFLFGLINNVLYVIILSAALDLVGADIPKGVVLLADVVPSFFVKLVAPYFISNVSYGVRVVAFVALSAGGMLIIGLSPAGQGQSSLVTKLVGVVLASVSSGGGELSFLALTHFYGQQSLAAWGSGTGGAGLLGAWLYVLATSTFGISSSATLLACSLFPVLMLMSYFLLLPNPQGSKDQGYQAIHDNDEDNEDVQDQQADALYHRSSALGATGDDKKETRTLSEDLKNAKALVIPYMLPLFLVYVAEYTINQGVAPTLLFPLASTPFSAFREFYPVYNALYQVGVFISRSSISFVRIPSLYIPSILQILNLVLLTLHAMFDFIPSVWMIFGIVFWEGLLGGAVYVNTFAQIRDNVPEKEREFSLATATVSDSGGIMVAAVLGMAFEKGLCGWQVSHGRDYCKIT